ncbi:MAG: OmpH family outer membrane protein [Rhodospirillales bacterium]|nr:OmpH family outer membrane protein [Rhodospirillales bacterium]
MRRFYYLFGIIALFALFFPVRGWAAGSIGVVDVSYILTKSDAALDIQKQRQAVRKSFLEEISKTEQDLRAEEKDLLEKRGTVSQEEYLKLRQSYEAKLQEERKKAQKYRRALEEASTAAMNKLREQLYVVVQEIANERGFELVISNKNVIAGEKSLDITEETLKKINESLKKVPLKIEEGE